MSFDTISEKLGLPPIVREEAIESVPVAPTSNTAQEDFDFARSTIISVIEKTTNALDEMIDLAKATEHHKAYDTVNSIAINITNMAALLVKMRKEASVKENKPESEQQKVTTNNTLVVTSTEDAIALIQNRKTQKKD